MAVNDLFLWLQIIGDIGDGVQPKALSDVVEGGGEPEEVVVDEVDDKGEHLVAPFEEEGEGNVANLFFVVFTGRDNKLELEPIPLL